MFVIYKNMPFLQILINLPFLLAGFFMKYLFFAKKGFGSIYVKGVAEGFSMSLHSSKKVPFKMKNVKNYAKIQLELWGNMVRRLTNRG